MKHALHWLKQGMKLGVGVAGTAMLLTGCVIEWPLDPPDDPPPPDYPIGVEWSLYSPSGTFCSAYTDDFLPYNGCPEAFPQGEIIEGQVFINSYVDGAHIEIFDACGGEIEPRYQDGLFIDFVWYTSPEEQAEVCPLVVDVVGPDGFHEFVLEVSFDGGVYPPPPPPPASQNALWDIFHDAGSCSAEPGQSEASCSAAIPSGSVVSGAALLLELPDEPLRALGLRDSCSGTFLDIFTDHFSVAEFVWQAPDIEGSCDLSLVAISEFGTVYENRVTVPVGGFEPPPPPPVPTAFWSVYHEAGGCDVASTGEPARCDVTVPAGAEASILVFMDWGEMAPGSLRVNEECGGVLEEFYQDPFFIELGWLTPPEDIEACYLILSADSADGLGFESVLEVSIGDVPPPPPNGVAVGWDLYYSNSNCFASPGESVSCPDPVRAGEAVEFFVFADWFGEPGDMVLGSTCGGEMEYSQEDPYFAAGVWFAPLQSGPCDLFALTFGADGEITEHPLRLVVE
ncbi:hypothetical protein Hoch_5263 [Haliangium ochraceum DSM 14365]|uniref:Lipoprotein n=2 Tax=Haliangium ochraceum TaxID=80816 RepID=D0LXJ3_HALO1|nr:hypothetical protein Hoch_5263 [Haliangium ochraceum DSM 14365]